MAAVIDGFYSSKYLESVSVLYGIKSHLVSFCYWKKGCKGYWKGAVGKLAECFIRAKKYDADQAAEKAARQAAAQAFSHVGYDQKHCIEIDI